MLQGLAFLHDSDLKYHGRLKSSNVVIDGRWACKLTDYGLHDFCEGEDEDEEMSNHAKYSGTVDFITLLRYCRFDQLRGTVNFVG